MSKVLIIGNGFDRQIGLQTDYFSFLDWMQKKGYGVDQKFHDISSKMTLGVTLDSRFAIYPRNNLSNEKYYEKYEKGQFKSTFKFENYHNSQFLTDADWCKEIYFFLPVILNQPSFTQPKPNVWYCFFQLLRFSHKLKPYANFMNIQGNWIDLEGIIKEAIAEILPESQAGNRGFSIVHFCATLILPSTLVSPQNGWNTAIKNDFIKYNIEKIKELLIDDFLELKETLADYIKQIQDEKKIKWEQFFGSLSDTTAPILKREGFGQIITFNYTNFIAPFGKVYHVHGEVNDGSKIVFGLDPFRKDETFHDSGKLSELEEKIFNDRWLSKFTKISQLLTLQKNKQGNTLISDIDKVVIIGHSIGVQDYSYYFSLIDQNENQIRIDCLWYDFNENKQNDERKLQEDYSEIVRSNNELSMQNALFEMLQQYERYAKKRILHRMIFEGRIKFIKIEIPTLEFISKHYPGF